MGTDKSVKQKILFIIESLGNGGAEKALLALLKRFDYSLYNVSLCVLYAEGVYWEEVPPQVKMIILYEKKNSLYRKSFRYYMKYGSTLLLKLRIKRKIDKHYDTIISFLEGRSLLFHYLIKERASKNITWVHCDLPSYHWTTRDLYSVKHEMRYYANMDKIVFVTTQAMENFTSTFHVDTPKECIYNVIDRTKVRQLAESSSSPRTYLTVTAIGSLFKVKAFDRLIRVAKMCKDANYSLRFQIIGTGMEELALSNLCNEIGVQDIVSFIGFRENPYPYLKNSDIFISTSISEGFSLVIGEAMSLGIPVISTRTAGAIELLEDGKFGMLTEHDDISIFEAIKKLIDDEELRRYYQNMSNIRAEKLDAGDVMNRVYNLLNQ